ncbi:type I-E CRISPR-associated protein Cas6/Cse3/CasE [Saccharothrix violaceirubra]|uniref:CRISPR system Cascade subunit CasE n=1 Tax=Saccharothrix violaceirubra TaxID=413306 RepID=A0A7W7WU33_9PSEU|nr:type I-E CRISPR-associated protein Cas6/Cse3/CasE [Saccharothrix violaceirubra]MBB4963766.1 CRISPR system Cascade subunit CasE [Saccharothrix violaceirubra]
MTKVVLDHRNPQTVEDLRNAYQMHVRVREIAEGLPDPDGGRLLWGLHGTTLLVQTGAAVSPLALPAGYAVSVHSANLASRLDRITAGSVVRWAVIANPTRARAKATAVGPDGVPVRKSRGQPTPVALGERNEWITRRLAPALEITALTGRPLPAAAGTQIRTRHRVHHSRHLWQGTATVADPDVLRGLVSSGIGHGKAFGCGLLLVAS